MPFCTAEKKSDSLRNFLSSNFDCCFVYGNRLTSPGKMVFLKYDIPSLNSRGKIQGLQKRQRSPRVTYFSQLFQSTLKFPQDFAGILSSSSCLFMSISSLVMSGTSCPLIYLCFPSFLCSLWFSL